MLSSIGLILCLAASAFCSDVIELTDSNFKEKTKDEGIMLVEFFAPWCGHCKQLAPEYETAATKLRKEDPPVPLAKVDCTESGKESCGKYGVSGYPTLKIFRNGEFAAEYDGPRDASGIVSFMKKQSGPSSKEIDSVEKMKSFIDNDDASIVGFFKSDDELKSQFLKTAGELRDKHRFAHTTDEAVMEEYKHNDQVVLFRPPRMHTKLEDSEVTYTGNADIFYIKKFISSSKHGIVGHMTRDNQEDFKQPLCVVYFKVDYTRNKKGTNYWRNRILKVAKKFKNKVMNFAIASISEFSSDMSQYGIEDTSGDQPIAAIKNEAGEKFVMKEDKFNMDSFTNFLTEYFDGKIKPYLKSEKIPEANDGPVKVVVGETFNQIVNDPTKDVLIEFYAPWCGHCKNLEPKFNELGEKFKDVKDIVIAKMDATANDVPEPFKVEGFPTLYWAPMNDKKNPKKYQSGREVSDFAEFIKREATNPVELPEPEKKEKKMKSKKTEL